MQGIKSVPVDLDHKRWQPDVVDLDGELSSNNTSLQSAKRKREDADLGGSPPKLLLGALQDEKERPYRVVSASKPSRNTGLMNIRLLTKEDKKIGCGWQPPASKAVDLNLTDYNHAPDTYSKCARCFKKRSFPKGWNVEPPDDGASSSDNSSAMSSDLFSEASDDTASNNEKVTSV